MKLKIAVVLVITALCLVAALWGLELDAALEALATARWSLLVPVMALYLVAHALRAWRLQLLVGHDVGYMRVFAINTVGFLAINVIPLRLGEFVRPYLLSEREKVPFGRGMAAIVLERLLDLTMLLLFLFGLTAVVDLPASGIQVTVQGSSIDVVEAGQAAVGVIVAAGVLFGLSVLAFGERVIRLLEKLPMGAKLGDFTRRFREGFLELVRRPLRALGLLLLSLLVWVVTVSAVGVCMAAFEGLPVGVGPAWATWTITISGMTAIPTAGFFGAYELFCRAALELWGVPDSLAATFALVLHLTQFGFIVAVGGLFLVLEGMSLKDLVVEIPDPDPAG